MYVDCVKQDFTVLYQLLPVLRNTPVLSDITALQEHLVLISMAALWAHMAFV